MEYIKGAYYYTQDAEYQNSHIYDDDLYENPHDIKNNSITWFFEWVRRQSILTSSFIYKYAKESYYRTVVTQMKSEFQDKNSHSYKESLAQWND
ncbi:hypothetical protein BDCR2A_01474 [Borrelia duttonii CR2A]|uniref:Uncharacterized protein n=1 Tax=Borrelia duttonii CR2A TaxID=1432657 RepID=W6TGT7_9SPIR|nr:hypothetical protein [Borrelia duttonii]ETZ17588.1 hypothetical protein BDCR2A_01474 [Borrelia duttonii CR2A]